MINFPNNNLPSSSQRWVSSVESQIDGLQKNRSIAYRGLNGLSAYQIAQLNGFTGTEVEWLESLKETFPTPVRWSPTFGATGLTFTGTNSTYPTYNSYYIKHGQLVHFVIQIDCTTVTNFGTGVFKAELPFAPLVSFNHFNGWVWVDPAIPADSANHIILNIDHVNTSQILDMHFLAEDPAAPKPIIEKPFFQGSIPGYNLTTVSKIYLTGTYISSV